MRIKQMIPKLFSPSPLWYEGGLSAIRILVGALMAYHGIEVFDRPTMEVYLGWDQIKSLPAPEFMLYLGKGLELVAGLCLMIGLFTRIAAILIAVDMLYICFFIGSGRFYYQDQHPFLFAIVALVFFFTGPVRWSVDSLLFSRSKSSGN
jgi:putative oxidoreductase